MLINKADDEWEWYIGMLFSKIMKDFNLTNCDTILEIAPGFRYKIAYALKNINFKGTLYIIDSSKDVCEYIKQKYSTIIPDVNLIIINKEINSAIESLPEIDLFLGNHIIDDIIIYNQLNINYKINENIQELLVKKWKNIYNTKKYIEINKEVVILFKNIFKKAKFCILSQYQSNVYLSNNNFENIITNKCFNEIKNMIKYDDNKIKESLLFYPFGNDERYLLPDLLSNVQNSKKWIVGEPHEFI